MKKSAVTFVAALVALATFWASDATAQVRQASGTAKAAAAAAGKAGAAGKDAAGALKIKQITKMTGSSFLVSSPEFDGKVRGPSRSSNFRHQWAMLEVEYATKPDWIDAATFNFHVMSVDNEKTYHYYTATVTYLDIAKGDHGACVMLPPSAVERYGKPIAFAVEIELEGEVIARESDGLGKGTPWWTRLDAMAGKGKLERHSGLLQDRSKTPFGLTYIDFYEVVR